MEGSTSILKPKSVRYIGEDKAMVTLNNFEPMDWMGWRRQKAANELGIDVNELPDEPDNGAEHADEQEKED